MKKIIIALIVFAVLFLSAAQSAPTFADSYGGPYDKPSKSKDIFIDKKVGVPHDVEDGIEVRYIDNVSTDTYVYSPYQVVYFELRVRNTSNVRLHDVVITDFGPGYFNLYENPGSVTDNTLTLDAGDFGPNEEKVFYIRGRIYHDDNVPTGTTCIVNHVRAEGENVSDEDTAQFCFHKGDEPVTKGGKTVIPAPKTIPSTGAAHGIMVVAGSAITALAGITLRRKA